MVCFAAWGLISAFAPVFRQRFHLSATQTALLVAVPVLLGALARLPMGMLADRFGGRIVFSVLMLVVAAPLALVPSAASYRNLLVVAFFLGMAGSSFAVGVGYVSRWFSMESQGSALGVYGLGNIGQSAAVFLGPVVAATFGFRAVYTGMSIILVVWAVVFAAFARNATQTTRPKGLSEMLGVLGREPLAWLLAAFYFLTFGGFVAFSIYLPMLLRDQFGLKAADAGFRTAGFVVLATLCRPLGGGCQTALEVRGFFPGFFLASIAFGLLLACRPWSRSPSVHWGPPRCLALATALCSNSFHGTSRISAQRSADSSARWVAWEDFFRPYLLGVFRARFGVVWPGFLLLSAVACLLWWANAKSSCRAKTSCRQNFRPVRIGRHR